MDWGIALFISKWVLLILVYLFLGIMFFGITREMSLRLPISDSRLEVVSYGRLRVLQPGSDQSLKQGKVLVLHPDSHIGSRKGNSIQLHDQYISGTHARIHWDGISWWLEDLNSTNGTYLNNKRIMPGDVEKIAFGDILQFGDVIFEMIE